MNAIGTQSRDLIDSNTLIGTKPMAVGGVDATSSREGGNEKEPTSKHQIHPGYRE